MKLDDWRTELGPEIVADGESTGATPGRLIRGAR